MLVLIDGHALAYRTFFALPIENFTTREGEPTNATYGFAAVLINVLRDQKPDYLAVCFDAGRTFRDDIFPEYKGTRGKMPDELAVQIGRIHELVTAFNIPIFEREGFEADDLLGTLAGQAAAQDVDALIVTGDRDLLQLVAPRVRVLLATRKLHESEIYDEQAVRARYGVDPVQLVDFKALVGDKTDNIPGVTGIGDKIAAQLLQQHGTLEAMLADLDSITPARARTALEKGRDLALLSQRLARIDRAVPITLDLVACRATDYDRARVAELFRTLEFRTLIDRLPAPPGSALAAESTLGETAPAAGAVATVPATPGNSGEQLAMFPEATVSMSILRNEPDTDWHLVTTEADLKQLLKRLEKAEWLSFDVETTSTDVVQADLLGVALSDRAGEGWYVAFNAEGVDRARFLDLMRPLLANPAIRKVAHNAKYDVGVLRHHGVEVAGLSFDTLVAEWLSNPASRNLGLKSLAFVRLGYEMKRIEELIGTGKKQITMAGVPIEQVAPYASADVDMTLRLMPLLEPELHEKRAWALLTDLELPMVDVLTDMELAGVKLDVEALQAMSAELQVRLGELTERIHALAGHPFNVDSTQQLSDVLFVELGLPTRNVPRTQAGKYSTAADVLEGLRGKHEVLDLILEQRQLSKLKGTYVDALPALVNPSTGRLHTDYNQCGAVTGRVSSSNPNLQNIPIRTELGRRVRRAFVSERGFVLLSADYSQIELRILAHVARDDGLLSAFARDEDIHRSAAAAIFSVPVAQVTGDQRRIGKTINFAVTYGQTAYGLAAVTGLSQEESQAIINAYFERFPGVRRYVDETKRKAADMGYVETLLGRRRYFPELQGPMQRGQLPARQRAEREAINAPIQGTSADIMKIAMIRLHQALRGGRARLILQVHDELVLEVPRKELKAVSALVCDTMENAFQLDVALKVDSKAGANWDEMAPVETGDLGLRPDVSLR